MSKSPFFDYITKERNDNAELIKVMQDCATDLKTGQTSESKPGILLGLIQSGKTRAFVGIMAKCFDTGFDVCVILTKNSVALAEQTVKRLKSEFRMPIERNKLYVWDIIRIQNVDQLTGYVLTNKIVFVVKKEINNLETLHRIFKETDIKDKNILVIDDEADQASVSFVSDNTKEEGIDFAKIASNISALRTQFKNRLSYLQVTATPYSLYLQPENSDLNNNEYAPLRPAFTHLLKPHKNYVGGKYYFEESLVSSSPASYLHQLVEEDELALLNAKAKTKSTYDQRLLNNILKTEKLTSFRNSIFNFLVGGSIRQLQESKDDYWAKPYHCAYILHTSTTMAIHRMQKLLVEHLISALASLTKEELQDLISAAYRNIAFSVRSANLTLPTEGDVVDAIYTAIRNKHIGLVEVNSENQVAELLGEDGQLRLDNPFNIFLGGQSLDRGITIDHLIGFFYGRNPQKFQMDTVLQHSRMYGNRSNEDLAVTRFYTSARIYESMRRMHWFDQDLRESIEKDIHTATARFIAKHGDTIIPAGPNKLKGSNLISFKALSRWLPIGFQTRSNTDIRNLVGKIDEIIRQNKKNCDAHFTLDLDIVIDVIMTIRNTFVYDDQYGNRGLEFDIDPFIKAIQIACERNSTHSVIIYFQENREAARLKHQGNSFGDAPDDGKTDLPKSRALAQSGPVLMLLKQKGLKSDGWRDAPFYWPVLVLPANMPNYIYCEN